MLMMTDSHKKRPAPQRARGVITVYGHRLSSLYRRFMKHQTGYKNFNIIVSKILNSTACIRHSAQSFLASGGSISETMMEQAR